MVIWLGIIHTEWCFSGSLEWSRCYTAKKETVKPFTQIYRRKNFSGTKGHFASCMYLNCSAIFCNWLSHYLVLRCLVKYAWMQNNICIQNTALLLLCIVIITRDHWTCCKHKGTFQSNKWKAKKTKNGSAMMTSQRTPFSAIYHHFFYCRGTVLVLYSTYF